MDKIVKWVLTVITIVILLVIGIVAGVVYGTWKVLGVDMFLIPFAIVIICMKVDR